MNPEEPLLTAPVELGSRLLLGPNRPSVRLGPPQTSTGTARFVLHRAPVGPGMTADIHLGCLWQTTDGESGAVQGYGGRDRFPRTGDAVAALEVDPQSGEEVIVLDLVHTERLRRMVFYVYSVSGLPDWNRLGPGLTLHLAGGAAVEMPVGAPPPGTTICAVTSVHQVAGSLVVRREAEYLRGQQSNVARAYDFEVAFLPGHLAGGY